jgi:hypothetical protein
MGSLGRIVGEPLILMLGGCRGRVHLCCHHHLLLYRLYLGAMDFMVWVRWSGQYHQGVARTVAHSFGSPQKPHDHSRHPTGVWVSQGDQGVGELFPHHGQAARLESWTCWWSLHEWVALWSSWCWDRTRSSCRKHEMGPWAVKVPRLDRIV